MHRDVDLAVGGRPPAERGLVSLAIRSHRLILAAAAPTGSGLGWRDVTP